MINPILKAVTLLMFITIATSVSIADETELLEKALNLVQENSPNENSNQTERAEQEQLNEEGILAAQEALNDSEDTQSAIENSDEREANNE